MAGTPNKRFVDEVNAAARLAASRQRPRAGQVSPRSAFWIALGRVAQEPPRPTRGGPGPFLASLGRSVLRFLRGGRARK